jgi:hypothetical protein
LRAQVVGMGFTSVYRKLSLPFWLIMGLAYLCDAIGLVLGIKLKLNPFAVKMLTMHRWFKIDAAETDLKYKPVIPYQLGWAEVRARAGEGWRGVATLALRAHVLRLAPTLLASAPSPRPLLPPASLGPSQTITWFRENWLPSFDKAAGGYAGKIAKQTQKKIDIQEQGAGAAAKKAQ